MYSHLSDNVFQLSVASEKQENGASKLAEYYLW